MPASLLQTARFRKVFSLWILTWAALQYYLLTGFGFTMQTAFYDSLLTNSLLAGTMLLLSISLQYYLPGTNKYFYIVFLCGVLTVAWVSTSRLVLFFFLHSTPGYSSFFSKTLVIRSAIGFLAINCMALISVLWYTLQDQQEANKRKEEADKLVKEAELNNLRQQLQPHFLFNSLNSINALIGLQPQQARTMVQQLSDFLRGTLKKEPGDWISLAEELEHLQLYLEIEKIRFGHRLSAVINNDAVEAKLPAMLLQPIVENAIKFGLYDTIEPITITIDAKEQEGFLWITITNPFDPETSLPQKGTGFGLSSVQRRLYLLFARKDLLQTSVQQNQFITLIKIPQA